MKKTLSMALVLAMVLTMLSGINVVFAATYVPGVVVDFDTNSDASLSGLTAVADNVDTSYGTVAEWTAGVTKRDTNAIMDFSGTAAVTTGVHVLSFDARVGESCIINLYLSAEGSSTRYSFFRLQNKNFMYRKVDSTDYDIVVSNAYSYDQWARYDLVLNFDVSMAELYIDGEYKTEFPLNKDQNHPIEGINYIMFNGSDSVNNTDKLLPNDIAIDNICYKYNNKT